MLIDFSNKEYFRASQNGIEDQQYSGGTFFGNLNNNSFLTTVTSGLNFLIIMMLVDSII